VKVQGHDDRDDREFRRRTGDPVRVLRALDDD
jgi:hypothetical protein